MQTFEGRCNWQEDYSCRPNLQFIGLDEQHGGETWELTTIRISKLSEDKFALPNIDLEQAHRVDHSVYHWPRPIFAHIVRLCDREAVMKNVSK